MKMQTRLAAVATAALAAAVPTLAVASHSPGGGPKHDSVGGSGKSIFSIQDRANATSGPSGEDARGHFYIRGGAGVFEGSNSWGDVTCLRVTGNQAIVGGVVTHSETGFPAVGSGVILFIEDNGEPGAGVDRINGTTTGSPPTTCPTQFASTVPLEQGNYVVHDAQP